VIIPARMVLVFLAKQASSELRPRAVSNRICYFGQSLRGLVRSTLGAKPFASRVRYLKWRFRPLEPLRKTGQFAVGGSCFLMMARPNQGIKALNLMRFYKYDQLRIITDWIPMTMTGERPMNMTHATSFLRAVAKPNPLTSPIDEGAAQPVQLKWHVDTIWASNHRQTRMDSA
jgi:hypothetical protein